jgi:hypothetical protein
MNRKQKLLLKSIMTAKYVMKPLQTLKLIQKKRTMVTLYMLLALQRKRED